MQKKSYDGLADEPLHNLLTFHELIDVLLHFRAYSDKVIISMGVKTQKEEDMGNNQFEEDEDLFVTLTLEDDTEVDCLVVSIIEAENGKDYIALLPTEGPENEEGEVFIYRYYEDEDGEPGLDNIETEAEFYLASEAFDALVESGEYDEIIEEEDNIQ